jgi:glycosyltransferase involved in cell wall biosynthesis
MIQRQNVRLAMGKVVVVLKGYPRLSETFIAQELLGLEQAGMELEFVSLRHPTDLKRHAVHDEIQAPVTYLPEYLHLSPLRVIKGVVKCVRLPGFSKAFKHFLNDVKRDVSRSRIRRFGQAMVLAAEWPVGGAWIYAHFLHTPADVAVYTSEILGIPWSVSAHAKDIWTSPNWNIIDKLNSAAWTVTCTEFGYDHLRGLAKDKSKVHLSYHGLNFKRFPPSERILSVRDGSAAANPVVILSVGRAVKKKGYDVLLKALSQLPDNLHWKFIHVGAGGEIQAMQSLAHELGVSKHIVWMGAINQLEVLSHYQQADVFVLACRVTADGDRDGLPNVLVEAASQSLACISTRVSGIQELFEDKVNGLLVESESPEQLASALSQAIESPALRMDLGRNAEAKVRETLDYRTSVEQLVTLFKEAKGDQYDC